MRLSPSVSPKFIVTSLLSGLTLKLVSFWDCLVLRKFPLLTWNQSLDDKPSAWLQPHLLIDIFPDKSSPPSSEHMDSFIHPFIHSKDAYWEDAYPHTAMAWRGKTTSFQRAHSLIEEQEPQIMRTTSLTLGTSPPAPDHTLWYLQFPFLGLMIASDHGIWWWGFRIKTTLV